MGCNPSKVNIRRGKNSIVRADESSNAPTGTLESHELRTVVTEAATANSIRPATSNAGSHQAPSSARPLSEDVEGPDPDGIDMNSSRISSHFTASLSDNVSDYLADDEGDSSVLTGPDHSCDRQSEHAAHSPSTHGTQDDNSPSEGGEVAHVYRKTTTGPGEPMIMRDSSGVITGFSMGSTTVGQNTVRESRHDIGQERPVFTGPVTPMGRGDQHLE